MNDQDHLEPRKILLIKIITVFSSLGYHKYEIYWTNTE